MFGMEFSRICCFLLFLQILSCLGTPLYKGGKKKVSFINVYLVKTTCFASTAVHVWSCFFFSSATMPEKALSRRARDWVS